MTDRFEIEVDTTIANEKWHVEVEENLKQQAESEGQPTQSLDVTSALMNQANEPPDVDRLARSMLMLHGDHDSHDEPAPAADGRRGGSWSKAPDFADDPERAAAVRAATQADRTRYLTSGLQPVDCRFCHATVDVKTAGAGTHRGAMEFRRIAALRLFRRATSDRRRTARGPGPARNWATASNTRLPRGAWRRCRPLHRPATASRSQPGEALLDAVGSQPVIGQ